jgi:divalent metal cation (Fe/Co/Zn/Cd) transporter
VCSRSAPTGFIRSLITLTRPADQGHPYGHAKFEILAAGAVGLSLLLMAYDVALDAAKRLLALEPADPPCVDLAGSACSDSRCS